MSILHKICEDKKNHVAARKQVISLANIQSKLDTASPVRGFAQSIRTRKPGLIAEIKKASPSGGLIRADFNPEILAQTYESAGAACLSILTDAPYFQGSDEDYIAARSSCTLPAIRKDFIVDVYQIYESRLMGADCILLIMASLDDVEVRTLYDAATELGMDILIEVHDAEELTRALALKPNPAHTLIGINSRNLKTMTVDLQTAHDLAPQIPDNFIKVAESGIRTHADLSALQKAGYSAFLVGESLMRQPDLTQAVKNLIGTGLDK